MNRFCAFSLLLLSVSGTNTDIPVNERIRPMRYSNAYHGEIASTTHPLTNLTLTENIPILVLTPIYEPSLSGYLPKQIVRRNPDLMFPLPNLHGNYPDPDLNDPISKRFLVDSIFNGPYPSMITLSQERYLHLQLDNDIFDYTDRFYTNGIRISFISPGLSKNPLNNILIPYWRWRGINYYGMSLVQDLFTPSTTKIGGILIGDRPYAAYLYIGSSKVTNDIQHRVRLTSEIQIGIIGPSSFGEYVQRTFHDAVPTNNEPLGWEFQIRNDVLLNYYARVEKGIVSLPWLTLLIYGSGSIGTVYTNIAGGTYVRSGWFNPYFSSLLFSKRSLNRIRHARNVQFYFFADFSGKAVGYDATLQGGMFNRTSPYTIASGDLNRMMFKGTGGIVFSFGGFQLKGEQVLISPEFVNGWWHKWLSIALSFSF